MDNYKLFIRKQYLTIRDDQTPPPNHYYSGAHTPGNSTFGNLQLNADYTLHVETAMWSDKIEDAVDFDEELEMIFTKSGGHDMAGEFEIDLFKFYENSILVDDDDLMEPTQKRVEPIPQKIFQVIEYDLNPYNDSDQSKISLRLDALHGARIQWHSCGESISNYIKADLTGLAKIERMQLAIEMAKKHITEQIKKNPNGKSEEKKQT